MSTKDRVGSKRKGLSTRRDFMKLTAGGVGWQVAGSLEGTGSSLSFSPAWFPHADSPALSQVVSYENAPDAGVTVRMGPEIEVMLAPEEDNRWGFFMFPSIWRLRDGRLICAVTMGQDEYPSVSDYHYLWYISYDNGHHWTHAVVKESEAEMFLRERFTSGTGQQIYYQPKMVSLDAISAPPLNAQLGRYDGAMQGIRVLYRLGDLPEECRTVTMCTRESQDADWRTFSATMDPDILVPMFKETVVDDDPLPELTHGYIATRYRKLVKYVGDARLSNPGVTVHYGAKWATMDDLNGNQPRSVALRLQIPTPAGAPLHNQTLEPVMEFDPGTLLVSVKKGRLAMLRQKGKEDRGEYPNMFTSNDGGRNWLYYSSVSYRQYETGTPDPNSNHGLYGIARAHLTVNMPKGNWLAMLRSQGKYSANSVLLLTRSYDKGRTWTPPVAIRPSSVNPVGGLLRNGVAYRMYGRPGQFVTFCSDGEGKLWGNDIMLVPAIQDPQSETGFRENTCANSSVVETGADRFLIAYTDYGYRDRSGRVRKAVLAREIAAEIGPQR